MSGTTIFFLCFGTPLFLIGGLWELYMLAFLMRAEETTGKIVGYETSRTKKGSQTRPLVEFQGPDGKTIQIKERGSDSESGGGCLEALLAIPFLIIMSAIENRNKNINEAGDEIVKVVYDPNNPQRAYIKSFRYLHGTPALIIALGFLICTAAIPVVYDVYAAIFAFLGGIFEKIPAWLI